MGPLPDYAHHRDTVPDGYRDWYTVSKPYTTSEADRERIDAAIAVITWYPPTASLPFSPGILLEGLIRDFQMIRIGGLGISPVPLEYPDSQFIDKYPHDLDTTRLPPDYSATCSLVAVKQLLAPGWVISYWLDTGLSASCLAVDQVTATHPPGVTIACVLQRHHDCPGTTRPYDPAEGRGACRCDCHQPGTT